MVVAAAASPGPAPASSSRRRRDGRYEEEAVTACRDAECSAVMGRRAPCVRRKKNHSNDERRRRRLNTAISSASAADHVGTDDSHATAATAADGEFKPVIVSFAG